jgi:hypothetical protein
MFGVELAVYTPLLPWGVLSMCGVELAVYTLRSHGVCYLCVVLS